MFECDCTQGYELNLDGYSCKPNNISYNHTSSESKLDEDYSTSDVFYQRGVSFSAELENVSNQGSVNDVRKVDNQR